MFCVSFHAGCGSLTHSGLVESSGESQWELLSPVDNTQLASQQRMIEKVKYFAPNSQQSTDSIEMAGMEKLQLQEERDRAREEMLKIKEEREKEKHRIRELEVLVEKERESIRRAEEERDRALLEKLQAEKEMQALNAKAKDAERMITTANQERDRALEAKKEIELQQQLEKEGVEERARELEKERDETRVEVHKDKEKSIQETKRSEEKTKLLKSEKDSVIEGSRRAEYEREREMVQVELERARKREAERLITKRREEYDRLVSEKEKIDKRCKFLEEENDRAKEEIEKERHEKQKAEMLMRKAEKERATTLCQMEEAGKKLRVLEEQGLAETIQKSEIEGEYEMEAQSAKVEIENLREQLLSQTEKAIEAEELAKVLEREKERLKADLENMETRAVVAETKLSENETEKAQEIREREHSIPEEREEEIRSDGERDELEELKKEHEIMRMKLEQAEMKANELQEKLEENERKELEKMRVENKATKSYNEEKLLQVNKDDNIEREKDEVIAEKTVKVTNEEQHIVWESYGLRLHIPPNSLPEDCSELQLNMTVSRTRDCDLPDENGILVSAVYSFSHNIGERKLRQKATLEMQHCVVSGSSAQLCIVQSDQVTAPHKFNAIDGGNFSSTDGYASIELDHFCSFSVYLKWYVSSLIWNIKCIAKVYYTNIQCQSFQFKLFIAPEIDALWKVCVFVDFGYNHFISNLNRRSNLELRERKRTAKWTKNHHDLSLIKKKFIFYYKANLTQVGLLSILILIR